VPHTLHHPSASPARLSDPAAVLRLVELARSEPPRPETVVLLADDAHLGHTCFIVSGTAAPDDVLDVAALAVEVAERSPMVHAAVLASVRPDDAIAIAVGGHGRAHLAVRERNDVDRGLELLELFEGANLELLDWFILGEAEPRSLRQLLGLPSLWRGGACRGPARGSGPPLCRGEPEAGGP
jgi:hypothetical protein